MNRFVVGCVVGALVGTVLWFALSPFLSDGQENLVTWLLFGSYFVMVAVTWFRARRKASS
jgi:uncharacterized membrane protein YciS (DUF1049 family)